MDALSSRSTFAAGLPAVLAAGLPAVLAATLLGPAGLSAQAAPADTGIGEPVRDLRSLLDEGFLLEDRNRDGHPDFVNARVVVPRDAADAEMVAAGNVLARLTFESYATDLGLLRQDAEGAGRDGTPVVVVGRAHDLLERAGVDWEPVVAGLAPGEGLVTHLEPAPDLEGGGVWLAGGDASGLLEAAGYLAGRFPSVWAPEEADHEALGRKIAGYLEEGGVPPRGLRVEGVVVSSRRPGVARLHVALRLPDDESYARALDLLGAEGDPDEDPDPRDLLVPGLHRLDVQLAGPEGREAVRRIRADRRWTPGDAPVWEPGEVPSFTLSDLYTTRGLYRDTREDLLPDRTEGYVSFQGPEGARGALELAQRIALETAGLRFPLLRVAGEEDEPGAYGLPILYGVGHYGVERLREEERLALPPEVPGQGFVEFVENAFDGSPALVVGGADGEGLEAAARMVAHRFPYLHENRKGAYGLADLEKEVRRFFQARGVAGQTALALFKLEQWLDRLEDGERPGIPPSDQVPVDRAVTPEAPGEPDSGSPEDPRIWRPGGGLASLEVELGLDTVPDGLEAHVDSVVRARFPDAEVRIRTRPSGFGAGREVFDLETDFAWEVDEVREVLRDEVLPRAAEGREGRLRVRVSEPPEVRRALAEEIADSLAARGIGPDAFPVTVLSAYKQGYSWIEDEVLPWIRDREVGRVEITYRHLQDEPEVRWKVVGSDTRWLQELFPVDEVVAREVGIPDSLVVFRARRHDDDPGEPVYRIRVLDDAGDEIFRDTFDPAYVIRPYFHLYEDYERVRITTGLVELEVDGTPVLERRVATDLERFWAYWQEEVLPRLRDYVMDLEDGDLSPDVAPFFDELRIDVRLSEPDHRIGIDEEVISSLESVHNDLYFHTLAFFTHLGQHYNVGALDHPGRILPHIDPSGDGRPGWARVRLTGREQGAPRLVLRTAREDGGTGRWRYDLDPLPTEAPPLRGVAVRTQGVAGGSSDARRPTPDARGGAAPDGATEPAIHRLLFDVVARDSIDRWNEHRERAPEGSVDRAFLSVEMMEGMVETVRALHDRDILEEALAFEGVEELVFRFLLEEERDRGESGNDGGARFERFVTLPRSGRPLPTRNPVLAAPDYEHGGERMVQWETPIPPAENDSVLARLATFPEADVYFMTRSYLGRKLWTADFLPPVEAALRSQARMNALRPTVFFSGRQHANEVSSTSHLLRLGELLVTDPEYRDLLQAVNVVINPVLNADGAQLAYEMQKVNPDFTLHAGYLGALGVDVTTGADSEDPIYPESRVRPEIMATWLPDIYINMHGYPSHEWVQHFSAYAAWVRGRTVTARTWWAPRGWFIPGFSWVDDPEHPEIKTAQFAILDTIAGAMTGLEEVEAMNRRQYRRYAKYGRQDVDGFREAFHGGMLVYLALRGRPAEGPGPRDPRINTFSATTEAPDETARGEWLELVASAGLAHSSALIRYLATGANRVERETEAFEDAVERRVHRVRPVLPPAEADDPEKGGDPPP